METAEFVFGSASISDLNTLKKLWLEAFKVFGYEAHHCEEFFFDLDIQTRVLRLGTVIVGTSMHRRRQSSLELVALLVAAPHRRQSVGSRLLKAVIVEAGHRNLTSIKLHTAAQNVAARGFFESHGFRAENEEDQYPRGQRAIAYQLLL